MVSGLSAFDPEVLLRLIVASALEEGPWLMLDSVDSYLGGPPLLGILWTEVKAPWVLPPATDRIALDTVLAGNKSAVGAPPLVSRFEGASLGRPVTGD